MNTCIAAIASINICIKAQKALTAVGVFSKIVSLDPSMTKHGCAYGIEFSCSEKSIVKSVLRKNNINPSQFIENKSGRSI